MNRIDRLLENYRSHIQMPLRTGLLPSQRVWFAVYPTSEERRLLNCIDEFEILKDNIHGLEIDERCTQSAAFNVALTAWKLAGYQTLPSLNLACSGLAPRGMEEEWVALAGNDERLSFGMKQLYRTFKNAPVLGSLIQTSKIHGIGLSFEFQELAPLLNAAIASDETKKEKIRNDCAEIAVTAQGMAKAAELLGSQFTLVITNVPYLGRGKQDDSLKDYCSRVHPEAKPDLATCFIERCFDFCSKNCSTALVSTQYRLFLTTYKNFAKS